MSFSCVEWMQVSKRIRTAVDHHFVILAIILTIEYSYKLCKYAQLWLEIIVLHLFYLWKQLILQENFCDNETKLMVIVVKS